MGLTYVSKVAWLNVLKAKMSSLWEIIAHDYVFSVKIADTGRGVWAILTSLIWKNIVKYCDPIPYSSIVWNES